MDKAFKTDTTTPDDKDFNYFDAEKNHLVAVISQRGDLLILCDKKGNRYPQSKYKVRTALNAELNVKPVIEAVKKEAPKPSAPTFRNDLPLNNKPRNIVQNSKQKKFF